MPTAKHESFSFGGVDSRSNPANYPVDRALRCLNFTPTLSGQLRLRTGFTAQLTNDTVGGTNSTIHSAVYYELFSASYLGPQYVLYGKNAQTYTYNLSTQLPFPIGPMGSSNPWGHFRAENRIFMATGSAQPNTNATASWESGDAVSWDGNLQRPMGLPAANQLITFAQGYAGTAATASFTGSTTAWVSIGNATGSPDSAFATVSMPQPPGFGGVSYSNYLLLTNFGFSIPTTAQITGMAITVTGFDTRSTGRGAPVSLLLGSVWNAGNQISPSATFISLPVGVSGPATIGNGTTSFGANLTPAMMNGTSFGVALQGYRSQQVTNADQLNVDACQITVYYNTISGESVAVTSSTQGSCAPTLLTGYQLFIAVYNPVTQHMGNRAAIGNPVTVGATASALVVSGLGALSIFSPEWVYALGLTVDGGEIPYWLVDSQGNNIVLSNAATMGTIYSNNINLTQELPLRNSPPPKLDKFARVGTRIFAGLSGNPFLYYSNDAADVSNANYVGIPEESWPADQAQPLPTGELPTSIHAYRLEGWFFSRTNLAIWSQFLQQQGANPWRGPWPGGCPSQRGFIETPHGPFWISTEKQLCTFMEDGVVSVSDEYELALLGVLNTATMNTVELGYLLDQTQLVDQIVIKGLDVNGNPVVVIHDFLLEEERSPLGQGYQVSYVGLNPQTFVGAGFTPRQNVYDTNGRQRLWAGAAQGYFAQLEDGLSDNGATYSADYIGLVSLGPNRPSLVELEYQGDPNIQWSYLPDYSLALGDFISVTQDVIPEQNISTQTRFGVKFADEECRWCYLRAQLTSHPADGSFALTVPPFLPIPTYGVINLTVVKTGRDRPEAR